MGWFCSVVKFMRGMLLNNVQKQVESLLLFGLSSVLSRVPLTLVLVKISYENSYLTYERNMERTQFFDQLK